MGNNVPDKEESQSSPSPSPSPSPSSITSSHIDIELTSDDVSESNIVRNSNNDFAYDGMWSFTGYGGMMVTLAEDFVKSRQELAEIVTHDPRETNINDENNEFVVLQNIDPTDEAAFVRLRENLDERRLHMADGVLRRLLEGCCPPRIRITRLDEDTTMLKLLGLKQEGNIQFSEKGYKDAIDCYDAALESVPHHQRDRLHVAPKHQITELVNILSNKAECLLRKAKYEDAASVSTEALVFDTYHEKSRLRRAKASLEIGTYERYEATSRGDGTMSGVAYLVQARHDLDQILENPESTSPGRTAAAAVVSDVDRILARAQKKVLAKNPDIEWDMTVLKIQSRCW